MRPLLFFILAGIAGAASADDLDTANKAFYAKDYPTALAMFTRLSDSGNPEAQKRLGEMYWYGEGATLDRSKGDALFAKAAAAGNQEAASNLSLSPQRRQKEAEIIYWTQSYNGADLTSGKYACPLPVLPPAPSTDVEIVALKKKLSEWRTCYAGFVTNIGDSLPAGKRIPADVAIVMSEDELQQTRSHLDVVYKSVMDQSRNDAVASAVAIEQWRFAAEKTLAAHNSSLREFKDQQTALRFIKAGTAGSYVRVATPQAK